MLELDRGTEVEDAEGVDDVLEGREVAELEILLLSEMVT